MKKSVIAALVGGLILFIWQFLSWGLLNLHVNTQKYTPSQNEILDLLSQKLEADGSYYLPTVPPGSSTEDIQKLNQTSMGKPWAEINFHKKMEMNMGLNMLRGIVVDIFIVFMLSSILLKMGNPSQTTIVITSLMVGIIGYLATTYTRAIWFETSTIIDLVDAVISFAAVGLWLGWWLRR